MVRTLGESGEVEYVSPRNFQDLRLRGVHRIKPAVLPPKDLLKSNVIVDVFL